MEPRAVSGGGNESRGVIKPERRARVHVSPAIVRTLCEQLFTALCAMRKAKRWPLNRCLERPQQVHVRARVAGACQRDACLQSASLLPARHRLMPRSPMSVALLTSSMSRSVHGSVSSAQAETTRA